MPSPRQFGEVCSWRSMPRGSWVRQESTCRWCTLQSCRWSFSVAKAGGRVNGRAWAARLLEAGVAFVAPTTWRGEAVGRLVFMHPLTPLSLIDEIVASLS